MPQPHSFTSPRLLVTIPSHFLNLPPQKNPTCKSMPQLHSLPSPRLLVTIPRHFLNLPPQNHTCKSMPQPHSFTSPSLLVTIPSHFLNLPPQNHTCKSMPQLHRSPPPRLLVTIPSHFLNLPPKTIHARVFLNFTASPLQDFLLDAKSFSNPPPKKNPTCKSIPLSKTSCHESKSFSKPPPQNPTCKSMSQLHSFTSPSLLVTSPSHFLNLPPPKPYMQEYASTSQTPPSKSSCHDSKSFFKPPPPKPSKTSCHDSKSFSKPPPPKPYMQEYSSTSQPPLSKTSC